MDERRPVVRSSEVPPGGAGPAASGASVRQRSLDAVDVFLFFVGFFAGIGLCVAAPWIPRATVPLPGVVLIALRHWLVPSRPRRIRPHTAVVGVFVGLLVAASVLLFGGAGIGFVRYWSDPEPDWSARVDEKLARSREVVREWGLPEFGNPAQRDASLRPEAIAAVEHERTAWADARSDAYSTSVILAVVGGVLFALAALLERLRTRPIN
jgi:hypothetical protein